MWSYMHQHGAVESSGTEASGSKHPSSSRRDASSHDPPHSSTYSTRAPRDHGPRFQKASGCELYMYMLRAAWGCCRCVVVARVCCEGGELLQLQEHQVSTRVCFTASEKLRSALDFHPSVPPWVDFRWWQSGLRPCRCGTTSAKRNAACACQELLDWTVLCSRCVRQLQLPMSK